MPPMVKRTGACSTVRSCLHSTACAHYVLGRFCENGLSAHRASRYRHNSESTVATDRWTVRTSGTKSPNGWLFKGYVYAWLPSAKAARRMDDGAWQDAGDP